MRQKIIWVLLGFLLCFSCVSFLGVKWVVESSSGAGGITTSSDGKYVYIIGDKSSNFYRSEDYGKTFENIDINPNKK